MPFEIVRNDITKMYVDAIVNPTNTQLFGTAGVDGRIHHIEGDKLRRETEKIGELLPGQCALSKAFSLPAKFIIHTVGPVWKGGGDEEEDILRNCYKNSLELAVREGFESVAFPLIASGSYGFPKDLALTIAVRTIGEFLLFHEISVYLVVYDKTSYLLSEEFSASVKAYIDDHYVEEDDFLQFNLGNNRIQERVDRYHFEEKSFEVASSASPMPIRSKKKSLEDVINHLEETFAQMLLRLIDEKGLKDPEVYKKANVTKQTFSKIRNNIHYNPTKQTVLAFAVALELSLDETKDLLLRAGYAFSRSCRFDVIMSYFFESKNYDIHLINEVLFEYDENLLGV